eukprot:m.113443 g.113443  ORF g.113443 m.113443 type:complete len:1151 (-) comp9133_c0_seq2:95-3547(-)
MDDWDDIEAQLMRELELGEDAQGSRCTEFQRRIQELEGEMPEDTGRNAALDTFLHLAQEQAQTVAALASDIAECDELMTKHEGSGKSAMELIAIKASLLETVDEGDRAHTKTLLDEWSSLTAMAKADAATPRRPQREMPVVPLEPLLLRPVVQQEPAGPDPLILEAEREHARLMKELEREAEAERQRLASLEAAEQARRVALAERMDSARRRLAVPLQAACRRWLVRQTHGAAVRQCVEAYKRECAQRVLLAHRARMEEEARRTAAEEEARRLRELQARIEAEERERLERERVRMEEERKAAEAEAERRRLEEEAAQRLAEQRAREEAERIAREQAEEERRVEQERLERWRREAEEKLRLQREEDERAERERRAREEEEKRRKELEAREAAERAAIEAERVRREREVLRKQQEELERLARIAREEEERRRLAAEAEGRQREKAAALQRAQDAIRAERESLQAELARLQAGAACNTPSGSSFPEHTDLARRMGCWQRTCRTTPPAPPAQTRPATRVGAPGPRGVVLDDQLLREITIDKDGFVLLAGKTISSIGPCTRLAGTRCVCLAGNTLTTLKDGSHLGPQLHGVCACRNGLTSLGPLPPAAASLAVCGNRLDSLTDLQAAGLRVLAVDGNQLMGFADVAPITGLQILSARDNAIMSARGLSSWPALQSIDLSGNRLHTCELSLRLLTDLDLSRNGLHDFPALANMTSLRRLNLSGNSLTTLAVPTGAWLPRLATLDASDNAITAIGSLAPLIALRRLILTSNRVSDVPPVLDAVRPCALLREVALDRNPCSVAADGQAALAAALQPGRGCQGLFAEMLARIVTDELALLDLDGAFLIRAHELASVEPGPPCRCLAVPTTPVSVDGPNAPAALEVTLRHFQARQSLLTGQFDRFSCSSDLSGPLHTAATRIQAAWRGHRLRVRLATVLSANFGGHADEDDFEFEEVDMAEFEFDENLIDADLARIPDKPARKPHPPEEPRAPAMRSAWARSITPRETTPHAPPSADSSTTPSVEASPNRAGAASRADRLMNEWGFHDPATAAAMLKRTKHLAPRRKAKPYAAVPARLPAPALVPRAHDAKSGDAKAAPTSFAWDFTPHADHHLDPRHDVKLDRSVLSNRFAVLPAIPSGSRGSSAASAASAASGSTKRS